MDYWEAKRLALLQRLEKHARHDQLDHGNWARGGGEGGRRLGSARGVGLGRIELPEEITDPKKWFSTHTIDGKQSFLDGLGPDGNFTEERTRVHDEIVSEMLDGIPASDDPTFTMMGGGTSSGKTAVGKLGLVDGVTWNSEMGKGDYVHVDPDQIKKMLTKKLGIDRPNDWAAFTHEESSYLAKRAMAGAVERSQDYLLDGTGDGKLSSVMKKITKAREAGYEIQGLYVTVPLDVAAEREIGRALGSGRKVPGKVIYDTHTDVSRIFPQVIEAGSFDNLKLYDNSGSKGASPTLVYSSTNGVKKVHNRSMYADFIRKTSVDAGSWIAAADARWDQVVSVRDTGLFMAGSSGDGDWGRDGDGDGYTGDGTDEERRVTRRVTKSDEAGHGAGHKADKGDWTSSDTISMLAAVNVGAEKPEGLSEYESWSWDTLAREVAAIRAAGFQVEIPND